MELQGEFVFFSTFNSSFNSVNVCFLSLKQKGTLVISKITKLLLHLKSLDFGEGEGSGSGGVKDYIFFLL